MRLRSAGFLVLLSFAACASQPGGKPWRQTYTTDLEAVRATIAADHPGMVDAQNPRFGVTMAEAYGEARGAAGAVRDFDSYRVALTRFVNRFQDAHLGILWKRPFESARDAGIVVARRGTSFVVTDVDTRYGARAAELSGAKLVACGADAADALFEKRVLSWSGRPTVEADWYALAPRLFVDYGPPTPAAPARCRFDAAGRAVELPLVWTPASPERLAALEKHDAKARALSVDWLDGRTVWVNLPTFAVNDDATIAQMHALVDTVKTATASGRWRLVVFDLRGNGGGSSMWGDQLAATLFGEAWRSAADAWLSDGTYVEWRVSPDNVQAVEGNAEQAAQRHGADSDAARRMRALHDALASALARGEELFGERQTRSGVPAPTPSPVPGRVVAITSPSCFSACLDFLDVLRLHPSVVQVGQVTGVDTVYMESWSRTLPSGNGRLGYPMKVFRNRRRGNNEAYAPAVRFEGDLDDDAAVREWVLKTYGAN